MADSVRAAYSASFDIAYEDTDRTRSLTADFINVASLSEARTRANTFGQALVNTYTTLVQPSGWRDDDDEENIYVIDNVQSKVVYKQEILIDPT